MLHSSRHGDAGPKTSSVAWSARLCLLRARLVSIGMGRVVLLATSSVTASVSYTVVVLNAREQYMYARVE